MLHCIGLTLEAVYTGQNGVHRPRSGSAWRCEPSGDRAFGGSCSMHVVMRWLRSRSKSRRDRWLWWAMSLGRKEDEVIVLPGEYAYT